MPFADVLPAGLLAWGSKLAAVWLLGLAGLFADFTMFDPSSPLGLIFAVIVILGTAWFTIRSKAIQFWKEEAEVARQRVASAEKEAAEQRALKHEALSQAAALQLKTDLTPILEHLAGVQQVILEFVRSDSHTATLEKLDALTAMMGEQNQLLRKIVEQNGGGV